MNMLTRDQAIEIVWINAVNAVDNENCEFTNRVGYNGSCQGDDEVEFSASVSSTDTEGNDVTITAYYYQDAESVDACGEDLSALDWVVYGYEVV